MLTLQAVWKSNIQRCKRCFVFVPVSLRLAYFLYPTLTIACICKCLSAFVCMCLHLLTPSPPLSHCLWIFGFGLENMFCNVWICEGFVRHRPPRPHPRVRLVRGRFGIDLSSIRHWFDIDFLIWPYFDVESMSNRCWIDAKSTPEEGRARRIRGQGPGGLCLINPSQVWIAKVQLQKKYFISDNFRLACTSLEYQKGAWYV